MKRRTARRVGGSRPRQAREWGLLRFFTAASAPAAADPPSELSCLPRFVARPEVRDTFGVSGLAAQTGDTSLFLGSH